MTHYCNRRGDTVTADEALDAAGNLRNGFGLRVPLQMCDSLQRDVAEFYDGQRRTKTLHRDPMGRELGSSEEEEDEPDEPRRRSKCDAVTGFTDSRGVFFAADQRMQAGCLIHRRERAAHRRAVALAGDAEHAAERQPAGSKER